MSDSTIGTSTEPVARLHSVVHQGMVLRDRGLLGRIMRSLSLRFMRPFIAYQEQVNVAVVESVDALQDRGTAYQVQLAEALAELRLRESHGNDFRARNRPPVD